MSTPFAFAEQSWPACFSALHLDRFLVGELAAAEADEVRAHAASCAKCSAALASLQPGEALPPLKVIPLRRGPWRALAAVAGVAAAASMALLLRPAPGERTKGTGFALGMYVQHDGEVRRAGPGEQVAAGDAVRFAVTAPAPGYVAVLSLDPEGRASIYFPSEGARAASVSSGEDVPLPAGTRLDKTVGEERIVGLLCASAVELEPVRKSLERRTPLVPEGCKVTRWSFVKR